MAAFNRIIMVGNLTRDPEYKELPSGQSVCRLGLASNRQIKNRQSGMMIQEVCYVDIDVWGAQAQSCNQYLEKGRAILVEGRLKFDSWKDAEGATKSKHSIVADRVVFLSQANAATEDSNVDYKSSSTNQEESIEFASQNTGKFKDAARAIKEKKSRKKSEDDLQEVEQEPSISGSASFKDEAPFEEELPF